MNIKEGLEFLEKGDKVVENLIKTLALNAEEEEVNTLLMEYIAAKFSSTILLTIKETSGEENIEDGFFLMVKSLMHITAHDNNIPFNASLDELENQFNNMMTEIMEKKKELDKMLKEYHLDQAKENNPSHQEIEADDMSN